MQRHNLGVSVTYLTFPVLVVNDSVVSVHANEVAHCTEGLQKNQQGDQVEFRDHGGRNNKLS